MKITGGEKEDAEGPEGKDPKFPRRDKEKAEKN